jgi:hypothetical protein
MGIRGVVSVRASPTTTTRAPEDSEPPILNPMCQCANETGKGKNIPLFPLMVAFLAFGSCSSKPAS